MKAFFNFRRISVPANGATIVSVLGRSFFVKESTGAFRMAVDQMQPFSMEPGFSWEMEPDESYSKLTFYNSGSVDITIEFYAGFGSFRGFQIVALKNVSSRVVYNPTVQLAAGASVTVSGTNNGNQRMQLVVSNLSDSMDLELTDENDHSLDYVFPRQKWTVPTNAVVKVKNPNGAPINLRISEFYYNS